MFSSCNKTKSSRLQRFSPTNFYHQKQQYSYSKMVKTLPIILCILAIFSTGNGAVVLQRNEGSNSVKNELASYDNEIISEFKKFFLQKLIKNKTIIRNIEF